MRFNRTCFILALVLFFAEAYIAAYVRDAFIRPFLGDMLVVILIYCFIRSFLNADSIKTAGIVLLIACAIEASQYFRLIELLGWGNSKIASLLLGTSFSPVDILMYASGALVIVIAETQLLNFKIFKQLKHERSVEQ